MLWSDSGICSGGVLLWGKVEVGADSDIVFLGSCSFRVRIRPFVVAAVFVSVVAAHIVSVLRMSGVPVV